MVTWSCPHCGHEYRVAEDGSVMIYPLNVYRTKNSCEFCGAIKNAGLKKITIPTRPIYPNHPDLTSIAVYAAPEAPELFIPYQQAEDSNTTTTVTIGTATSSPVSSKRAKRKINKASSSNG